MDDTIAVEIEKELRVTEDTGDVINVWLNATDHPEVYQRRKKELIDSGMSEEDAIKYIADAPIQLELFYSKDQGLFAVESEALESIEIYNPYDGTEIPNDNLI